MHISDGTIVGCTEDEDPNGCAGATNATKGSPVRCVDWARDGWDYCGVH